MQRAIRLRAVVGQPTPDRRLADGGHDPSGERLALERRHASIGRVAPRPPPQPRSSYTCTLFRLLGARVPAQGSLTTRVRPRANPSASQVLVEEGDGALLGQARRRLVEAGRRIVVEAVVRALVDVDGELLEPHGADPAGGRLVVPQEPEGRHPVLHHDVRVELPLHLAAFVVVAGIPSSLTRGTAASAWWKARRPFKDQAHRWESRPPHRGADNRSPWRRLRPRPLVDPTVAYRLCP